MKPILYLIVAVTFFLLPGTELYAAQNCSDQIEQASALIEKTEVSMDKMARMHKIKGMMSSKEEKDTEKLLKQAKQSLELARMQHDKAKSDSDFKAACKHAASAIADAETASKLHMESMKN